MGIEFFTNEKKTQEGGVDVDSPAFSATKVVGSLGVLIAGVLGAVPASLKADQAVVIAAIAAATVLLLGVFALMGVDISTRQKAKAAALRYGSGKAEKAKFQAMPTKDLVLQMGHNSDEYEVRYAAVEDGLVHVFADHDGTPISATFKEAPKPK